MLKEVSPSELNMENYLTPSVMLVLMSDNKSLMSKSRVWGNP